RMIGTLFLKPGSSVLSLQSTRRTKSLNDFSLHRDLSGFLDSLRASQSIVPLTTFQWPLSPSGTFQPVRSLPLKSEVNPSGGALSAASALQPAATSTRLQPTNQTMR